MTNGNYGMTAVHIQVFHTVFVVGITSSSFCNFDIEQGINIKWLHLKLFLIILCKSSDFFADNKQ